MKTATITWLSFNNYGTQLQAYALQQYLLQNDVSNEIISDSCVITCNDYIEESNNIIVDFFKRFLLILKKKKNNLSVFLHKVKKLVKNEIAEYCIRKTRKKQKYYNKTQKSLIQFKRKKLFVRKVNQSELDTLNSVFDLFICGSDQIWSLRPKVYNSFFYLDFVSKPKLSFSCSVGLPSLNESDIARIKENTKDYKSVSFREKQTCLQYANSADNKAYWTCDPTLLFDDIFWTNFCKKERIKKGKYLLCYFLEDKEWYFRYAKSLADCLNLNIILIPSRNTYLRNENRYIKTISTEHFVALFKSADFVLTDSYHGILFSLLFNKDFLPLIRFDENDPMNQNIRIESILEYLQLSDIKISNKDFAKTDLPSINWNTINNLISAHRTESQQYIINNIK